jgi:hypothetical protein
MAITVDSLSRFGSTEIVSKNGIISFGLWNRYNFTNLNDLPEEDVTTIQINQNFAGRPDLIANEYYGSPYLEWIVTMSNRPLDPLGFPKAGTIIKIPKRGAVFGNF